MAIIVVVRRFFRGLAQGHAEMKKTGSKRGSEYDIGLGSAVLEAPEENHAPATETRTPWQGRGPAPAGALQRGYGSDDFSGQGVAGPGYGELDEPEYVPRRGSSFQLRFRGLPRSIGGRIVFGVVVFAVLGAVAVAVAGVRFYLQHDSRFLVGTSDDIQITGAEHLTRDQILSVFGADLERNIFRVSLAERRADLERLPWVAHATVMRLLPNQIRVAITERTPVAFVRQGTQIGLVDAGGVLLDMPPDAAGDPHYSFPVLTGLSTDDPLSTRAARTEIYLRFMQALDGTGEHLTNSLSEVDVSNPEDVKALITSGSSDILVHFGQEEFLKRYREFQQHLPEWKQEYPKLASADMRYEGQIVLEMQGAAGAAPAEDGSAAAPAANADAGAMSVVPTAPSPAPVAAAKPPASVKPAKPKLVAAKATKPAAKRTRTTAKRTTAKKPVATKKAAAGKSAVNQKEFAALAAAHKAALARVVLVKAAKRDGASGSGGVTP
jgi:cell division protein FtsQ